MNRIDKQILLQAPRARVWRAITTDFGAWFGHDLADELVPGATIRARTHWHGREQLEPFFVVESLEPEQRFAFHWGPPGQQTVVELRLEEVPGGTLLAYSETGYAKLPEACRDWMFKNDVGWTEQLRNLARVVSGEPNLEVKISERIARPVRDVFEAIVDPGQMAGYFISHGSGRMTAGQSVEWKFADVGATLAVDVIEATSERVVFDWTASGSKARVTIELAADGDATKLAITESGWRTSNDGIKRALGQTQGWTDFACCLKAYLLHGVNLRAGR